MAGIDNVILVSDSYGGAVITGVADRLGDRIDLVGAPPAPGTIITATESAQIFGFMRQQQAPERAKERGWKLYSIEGPHPLQETSPSKEKLASILLDIAKTVNSSPSQP